VACPSKVGRHAELRQCVAFLEAFNKGDLKVTADRVVCGRWRRYLHRRGVVARRLGKITSLNAKDRPEEVIGGYTAHDAAMVAAREGATVTLTALFPQEKMTATEHEVHDALHEGVTILNEVMPIALVKDANGRATALRMAKCTLDKGRPIKNRRH